MTQDGPRREPPQPLSTRGQATDSELHDIPPAGRIGRILKLVLGVLQLLGVGQLVFHFEELLYVSWNPTVWLFVVLAFWLLPMVVALGFGRDRTVGRAPLWTALGVGILLAAITRQLRGTLWAPPLTIYVLAVTVYTHLHMGLCHVLAAIVGLPGCEMRVLPYLASRLAGSSREGVQLQLCPGLWTPLDRWEAGLHGGRR